MIRKTIISLIILHGMCVAISNSLIEKHKSRALEKWDPLNALSANNKLLQDADMVFRLNMDGLSQFIKKFNRHDKQYSHAGVVIIENGHPVIYHMVNGEESKKNKMVKSSFVEFINPKKNYAFGIYRNELSDKEKQGLVFQIKSWYDNGLEFDFDYDLKSDEKMYCSEMISKAISKATHKRIDITTTKLTHKEALAFSAYSKLPIDYTKDLEVVAIDDLYKHKGCKVVKEYRFY